MTISLPGISIDLSNPWHLGLGIAASAFSYIVMVAFVYGCCVRLFGRLDETQAGKETAACRIFFSGLWPVSLPMYLAYRIVAGPPSGSGCDIVLSFKPGEAVKLDHRSVGGTAAWKGLADKGDKCIVILPNGVDYTTETKNVSKWRDKT